MEHIPPKIEDGGHEKTGNEKFGAENLENAEKVENVETPQSRLKALRESITASEVSLDSYASWKASVPLEFRRIIEGAILRFGLKSRKTNLDQESDANTNEVADLKPANFKPTNLPLTDEFLNLFCKKLYSPTREIKPSGNENRIVLRMIDSISRVKTDRGYFDLFDHLLNPDVSWDTKREIYDTQLRSIFEWLVNKDLENIEEKKRIEVEKREKKKNEKGEEDTKKDKDGKELEKTEKTKASEDNEEEFNPPKSEEAVSSMEQGVEKNEGQKPENHFKVYPFFGGYYQKDAFNSFNKNTGRWRRENRDNRVEDKRDPDKGDEKKQYIENKVIPEQIDLLSVRFLMGSVNGSETLSLPIQDNWSCLNPEDTDLEILKDELGLWYLKNNSDKRKKFKIKIGRNLTNEIERRSGGNVELGLELPPELKEEIGNLRKKSLPRMKLYREIVKLIRNGLTYSNNPEAFKYYLEEPDKFLNRVWEKKEADCFVANTLAVASLKEVGAFCSFRGGYYVKEKDKNGNALMHGSNGHAWLKVWDSESERWVRLDATPKGDPNVDQEEQDKELEGEDKNEDQNEGDYGEKDELFSSDELKKEQKKKKAQASSEKSRKKSENSFNFIENNFAKLAECSESQAREYLRALERVRKITDKNGVPISASLIEEWKKVVTSRIVPKVVYKGPVRMSEGDDLVEPVDTFIDIASKESDPTGFEKEYTVEKIETDFGGLNLYFSFDLSGSMAEPDPGTGRQKRDVQRDTVLLLVDAIMQCASVSRRVNESEDENVPIKIMVTLASSVGEIKLPLTDKWGPKEQWALYSSLNQTASGGTPTHETLALIKNTYLAELKLETENVTNRANVESGNEIKPQFHYTAVVTDGKPNNPTETEREEKELKEKGMAVGNYIIGGEDDGSGRSIESFNDLPQILSKDIRDMFNKLKPKGRLKR